MLRALELQFTHLQGHSFQTTIREFTAIHLYEGLEALTVLSRNVKQHMRLFSRSFSALRQLLFCAVILALWLSFTGSSADGSSSNSRKEGLSSNPSIPVAKSSTQKSLIISPDLDEFSQNPKLLQRILRGPHGYFRRRPPGELRHH